jgi:cytochrome c biogenesis protein CcmG/thiol:disulfide interchange protein DsbE
MSEEASANPLKTYMIAAIPLVLFLAVAIIFYRQLTSGINPNDLPSVLINQPAPDFPEEPLVGLKVNGKQVPAISMRLVAGKVTVVNVWASWCVPCRIEHPIITKLAEDKKEILLVGINYKDKNLNALRFLGGLGNPYGAVSIDPTGSASIDWGVYGIPETFILDRTGIIIFKHVGPLNQAMIDRKIIPIIDGAL